MEDRPQNLNRRRWPRYRRCRGHLFFYEVLAFLKEYRKAKTSNEKIPAILKAYRKEFFFKKKLKNIPVIFSPYLKWKVHRSRGFRRARARGRMSDMSDMSVLPQMSVLPTFVPICPDLS